MSYLVDKIRRFLNERLWEIRTGSLGRVEKCLVISLRLLHKIGQEFTNGEIPRRASSLVYRTLLTFVPVLAVSFSVVKAFGVHNMLIPFIKDILAPLGEKGDEIALNVITYVERMNVGLLGAIGLAALIYTVMSAVQQIEDSFNYLWQVREKRGLLRRFTDYMSVLLAGPVLMVSALGITTFLMSHSIAVAIRSIEPFGSVLFLFGKLLPYFLGTLAFSMVYYLLPFTNVNPKSALVGGVSAGILWQIVSWAFARFIVSSTHYSAVYSGFAMILLFMIWLYFNWVILLIGAKVSFYHQFPALLHMRDDRLAYGESYMQRLTIVLMCLIGHDYVRGQRGVTSSHLMQRVRLPKAVVQDAVDALERGGLILRVEPDQGFVPARDMEAISLGEIVGSVRGEFRGACSHLRDFPAIAGVEKIMAASQKAADDALAGKTLKDLVNAHSVENQRDV